MDATNIHSPARLHKLPRGMSIGAVPSAPPRHIDCGRSRHACTRIAGQPAGERWLASRHVLRSEHQRKYPDLSAVGLVRRRADLSRA